jgi:DNA-binding NarL/FixJ family response regulator
MTAPDVTTGSGREPVRVIVAHPSALLRDLMAAGMTTVPAVDVVATTATREEMVQLCRVHAPAVVVAAPELEDGELVAAVASVLRSDARIVLLSEPEDARRVSTLLMAGASGCLQWREAGLDQLVAALTSVARGGAVLHPAAATAILQEWRTARAGGPVGRSPVLSVREGEVLEGLARGLQTKMISKELLLSPKTVDAHIARLLAKLGANNRAHAVSLAQQHQLLASDSNSTMVVDE